MALRCPHVQKCLWSWCRHIQPRDMIFIGRNIFIWVNYFIVRFARIKNCPFDFLVFQKESEKKILETKGTVLGVCKTNYKKILPNESSFADEMYCTVMYCTMVMTISARRLYVCKQTLRWRACKVAEHPISKINLQGKSYYNTCRG